MNNTIISMAAAELLRRGYTGEMLQTEVQRFCGYVQMCENNSKPLTYPDKFLQNKWTVQTKPNADLSESGKIADFIEATGCNDLEAICTIVRMELQPPVLYVHTNVQPAELKRISTIFCAAANCRQIDFEAYMRAIKADMLEYKGVATQAIKDGKCWVHAEGRFMRVTREYAKENGLTIFCDSPKDKLDTYYKNFPHEKPDNYG